MRVLTNTQSQKLITSSNDAHAKAIIWACCLSILILYSLQYRGPQSIGKCFLAIPQGILRKDYYIVSYMKIKSLERQAISWGHRVKNWCKVSNWSKSSHILYLVPFVTDCYGIFVPENIRVCFVPLCCLRSQAISLEGSSFRRQLLYSNSSKSYVFRFRKIWR